MLKIGTAQHSRRRPQKSTPKQRLLPNSLRWILPMLANIQSYTELRKMVRETLRRQHPEWIDANGNSRLCDYYEARLDKVLTAFTARNNERSLQGTQYTRTGIEKAYPGAHPTSVCSTPL